MSAEHRFKDEWIVRAVLTLPGITSEQINDFRRLAKPFLSQSLVQVGLATLGQLGEAVQKLYKIPLASAVSRDVDKMAVSMLPERICQKLMAFPLQIKGEYIEVAMANPLDVDAQRDIQVLSGRTVIPFFSLPDTIQTLIAEFYSGDNVLKEILSRLDVEEDVEYLGAETNDLNTYTNEQIYQPVIKLANSLIAKAVTLGASDIHIEHDEKNSYVRYRIDGVLRRVMNLPKSLAGGPLISRIKIMANLDVADHNRPQDGGAKVLVSGKEISLRVSTLPTNYGEKAVIRILDPTATTIPFEQMGFPRPVIARLENLITAAQGIILVTGPTGSGKTTTLYTALSKLKSEDTNIVTVEDPIEYKLPGINQVQVNEKAGLTFSSVLRSVLRQDPDVILIGEIRDAETANIAFQAAITGHIVFSTLHTNDSISAISRLHDMGVERFKLAPGLLAITAQRLVRRLCKNCRTPSIEKEFDPHIEKLLAQHKLPKNYWKPVGCEQCNFLGYKGRLAVVELLELNTSLRERIAAGDGEESLRQTALRDKALYPMILDILTHLSQGDTSLEEILPFLTMEAPAKNAPQERKTTVPDDKGPTERTVGFEKTPAPPDPLENYGEIVLPDSAKETAKPSENPPSAEELTIEKRIEKMAAGPSGPPAITPVELEPILPEPESEPAPPESISKPEEPPTPTQATPPVETEPKKHDDAEEVKEKGESEPPATDIDQPSEPFLEEEPPLDEFISEPVEEDPEPILESVPVVPVEAVETPVPDIAQSPAPAQEAAEPEAFPSILEELLTISEITEQNPADEPPSAPTPEQTPSIGPIQEKPEDVTPALPENPPAKPEHSDTPEPVAEPAPAAKTVAPKAGKGADIAAPPDNEVPAKKGEVMIVDDNAALRLLLRCILEDAGFSVTEAKDGGQAMEILLNKTPDVMLLDINMPKLSGEEVIKRVRQSMNLFPIIVLTTNSDDRSQIDTLSLGADDYIIKPFIPSIVLARVRAAMRRTGK